MIGVQSFLSNWEKKRQERKARRKLAKAWGIPENLLPLGHYANAEATFEAGREYVQAVQQAVLTEALLKREETYTFDARREPVE